jgi:MFS transporter, DHA2 family, multidrug resistance protein
MQTIHDERVDLRTWVGVLGTMLGAFMATLDIQVTNASLQDITGGIAATQDEGSWVSTSYLIGEIITIPLTAWLARVFSVRWLPCMARFIFCLSILRSCRAMMPSKLDRP